MKKVIKICLALAGTLFALGLTLNLVGTAMGGRSESIQYYEDHWEDISQNYDWGNFQVNADGVHIGGENGIHVDSGGVSIGGNHGIHVGHHNGNGSPSRNQLLESGNLTGITAVEVDVDCGDIWLQEGSEFSVSLDWNLKNYAMSYQVEDGILKVGDESWGNVNANTDIACKVLITVPSGTALDEIELSTDMGDIEVDAAITAREASISTNLGDVACRNLQAMELDAESDLGDVKLHLPSVREDYTWDLETSLGDLILGGEKQSGGMGTITNCGGAGKNMVEASTSLGNVEVDFSE